MEDYSRNHSRAGKQLTDMATTGAGDGLGSAGQPGRSHLLRGGRMTKWKGEVASYAPNVAQVAIWISARSLPLSISAGLLIGSAAAADRYWDPNGTAVARGGTGVWNLTSSFWSPSPDGVSGPYSAWSNSVLDRVIFGGTAGTVTLGAPITANSLTFEVPGYILTGGTLTLAGANPTISTIGGATGATINSVITGTAGLTKGQAGTINLNGANTFTGTINVLAGTLGVNGDAALGAAANRVVTSDGSTFVASGALGASRIVELSGGVTLIGGAGVGSARFTGAGGIRAYNGVVLNNDANDFTGQASFFVNGSAFFTSVGDVGQASSLGAGGTIRFTAVNQYQDWLYYTGSGGSSNRDWEFATSGATSGSVFVHNGTGTLTLTGNVAAIGAANTGMSFVAEKADLALLGEISSVGNRGIAFRGGGVARTITLGNANTYAGTTGIGSGGAVTLSAAALTDTGTVSSFGTGAAGGIGIYSGSVLSYTGASASSDRNWTIGPAVVTGGMGGTIANDGTGALALSGTVDFAAGASGGLVLGGIFSGQNTLSGVISGNGALASSGSGTWVLGGANTRTGAIVVNGGTLRAGNASAFGTTTGITVNSGTLDLNGFDMATSTVAGTGGTIALGSALLSLNSATSTSFAGNITGSGGLTKAGAGTLTLSGTNTYAGATSLSGGGITLNFSAPGAPADDIIAASSALSMAGSTLTILGGGVANSQSFNGLNVTAGGNRIVATSGAGGSVTVNLGTVTRTGGLIDFALPASGRFTTTSASLGGWATVNRSDYAKVVGGVITAFDDADYVHKDNAATWQNGEIISDTIGFHGAVAGSVQLGGLRYTRPVATTVTIADGQTLGTDGTIIVAPSVLNYNQLITGGSLTGSSGGGVLGLQQNSTGNFTIASTITDNGGVIGFTKGGSGVAALTGANTYSGVTTLSGGTLAISSVNIGGQASSIGKSSADSSNLVLESGTLRYTGITGAVTDRGFTLVNGSASAPAIEVDSARTVEFSGLVTSPDDAGLTKTGLGTLILSHSANDYVGITTITGSNSVEASTIAVNTLANGGIASGIGAASKDSANLVLNQGGRLRYTGATIGVDRGFTLGAGGGRIDVAQTGTTLTVSGTAVGAGGLIKEGTGTLVLTGTNTYTGDTVANGGTLRAGSTQAFGPSGFMTVNGPAKLELGGYDITVGGLLGDGTVDLGNKTLTSNGGSANGFTGRITGTGGFTRIGSWTQTLSGCNNDYTGKTTIGSGGTLHVDCLANGGQASGIGASTNASANLVFNNGTLSYSGGSVTTDRGFTLQGSTGSIVVSQAATTLEFTGQAVGAGNLAKGGAGTLVLSGANTYSGATSISGGILRANSSSAFGSPAGMTLSNTAGVLLDLNGFTTTLGYLAGGGTTGGNVSLGGATLTLTTGGSGTASFAGAINGSGALVKSGTYTQVLSGCASTYTGGTTINGGVLDVTCLNDGGVASSIGLSSANAANLVINGSTLRYSGVGGSTDRRFTLGASGGNALDASGTGAISFTSTAPVTFAAANTPQTLTLTGTSTADNKLAVLLTNNGTGLTALNKTGAGTWILTNSGSTYGGATTISGGVLGVDKLANGGVASSLGASSAAASNLVIGNGSTLRYTGAGDTTNRLFTLSAGTTYIESSGTGAIVFTDTGPVTLAGVNQNLTIALGGTNAGNNVLAGSIGNAGTGTTILAKNDSGTWVLSGNNTFTGNAVVNGGRLVLGNGGATGSIVGDAVVVAGTRLAFNRSNSYSHGGSISGNGGIDQIGSGTTILTGANSYKGTTNVNGGTLLVNGNQSVATGLTTVNSGATLGGRGTIGGDVVVAGGTLAPGNSAGTLTINGNLTLDAATRLAMEFGQANVVGGALNDLVDVKGNLTLDGTLNVSETAGGSFGPGIYRVISYTGSLTDNGLDVGTLPGGVTGATIQTSVAGQINLVNTSGNLNFWDGDAGPKFNGVVNGGNGSWQSSAGNTNWTETTGAVNAAYSDGTFAIFTSAAGTVTIDNSWGAVGASGMQFATNGYVIQGGALTLVGPQSTIRVGDGTAASAGMTATVASQLTGNTQLLKTDAGTLVLSGANTYSGGTAINGGTLQVAADGNLGAASGGLSFGGGTLNTTSNIATGRAITLAGGGTLLTNAGTTLTSSGAITGSGALTKSGTGALILTGNASHGGGTTVAAGTLQVGSGGTTGSISGGIVNNGALVFSRSNNLAYAGSVSGTGTLSQSGTGTLTLTGASTYTGATTVGSGKLLLQSGGRIDGTASLTVGGSGEMIVDGTGSRLVAGPNNSVIGSGNNSTGSLTVRNAGSASFALLDVANGTGSSSTLNIVGRGSRVTQSGQATFGKIGTASVNVLDGGEMVSSGAVAYVGGQLASGSSANVAVSGRDSRWTVTNSLNARRGTITVSDGGVVTAGSSVIGFHGGVGLNSPSADMLVTGAGSRFETSGALAITNSSASGSRGSITIAVGGVVRAGSGTLAMGPGDAALNIGGAEGGPAAHAGTLDADSVVFGAATGRVNFNHDDASHQFTALMSGVGAVNHNGPGATVLTRANSYAGATTINAGSLYVNGDQSAATGLTTASSGGTLGGIGTIGGNVVVANGGAIDPGGPGTAPGTLTINGNLTLNGGSKLNYSFGQANVEGGAFNDLIKVGGDLTLGGTLNAQITAGASFDPGVYRVISYDGALTNNGLAIGTIPSPNFYVQTSVDHQVNLVNTAGLALRYWDGAQVVDKNDNEIDGGNGRWQANAGGAGNDNWTETGVANAPFEDAAFAVFMGAVGTVRVDGTLGAVNASGMQFLTDGYVIDGDAISLVGTTSSVIRVGDGTTGGAAIVATIASDLTGASRLVKSDLGTLILTGNNGYAGGTAINGGTLRIAADGNLGVASGGLSFDGGTLNTTSSIATGRAVALAGAGTLFTNAGTTLSLSGAVTGAGALTKSGAGTLVLTGNAAHSGGTTVAAGTLQVGNGGSGGIAGDIVNNGAVVFNRSNDLVHAGAISGSGSLRQSGAGTLTLTGASTYAGSTAVDAGALTLQSGGRIVGTSSLTIAGVAGTGAATVIDGAGTRIVANGGDSFVGDSGTGTLTLRNGGSASFAGLLVAANAGSNGTLDIIGLDSEVTTTGSPTQSIGSGGTATLNILDRGRLVSGGVDGVSVGFAATGRGTITVSGGGSRWSVANALDLRRGSVTVSDGGVVTSGTAALAGGAAYSADLIVTGADSRFETTGALTLANHASATGTITIADGGLVRAGSGTLAMGPGNATLNIGAAAGGPAVRAGTLDAAALTFGVATNRVNFNHIDAGYLFSATISGAGAIDHNGPGATVLSGANSYAGATNVNAGTLFVNGDQSGASGLTTAHAGSTLGGIGTIGGDVIVANGGAINPGNLGAAPGTLTIAGNLDLAANAVLNYSFGKANVPGGPLNDLIDLDGDLVLDGTLNVLTSAGGRFDPGLYRVIDYGGALTNRGLAVGTIPSSEFYVQTSIPGQVNLVNTAGLSLRYWDGDGSAAKNNGVIEGGNGLWQNFAGNEHWTEETGASNAPFNSGSFAIFTGAAGTVTVDDSLGAINASGMQFLADGYLIQGDAINLVGAASSVIRVGDGTTGGASVVATIASDLTGATQLVKSDLGTLILQGGNGHTGGTAVDGGTLQIAADRNLGAATGGLSFDGGTLRTTADISTARDVTLTSAGTLHTDDRTVLTLSGAVTGAGSLTKDGAGTLLLLSNATHSGGTTIARGTLRLGNGGEAGGLTGDVANDGLLVVNRSNDLTLEGQIYGGGAFTQAGTGRSILSGVNSYKGATTVGAGTLLVNGDQSGATGATTVGRGATLGGAGTIGGDVSIANGAKLVPGSTAGAAGTLRINGNLSLAGGATLNMQFGQANVAGGAFNDLVNVGGDLVLDGTLDVSVSPRGTFGVGIYRVINYGGSLTDNGLSLGAMPASGVFLQTSVAGQVNLVNGAGLTLNYWDGAGGPKFDHKIAGGDGVWQNNLGNDNWTDATGDINAAYTNGSFAIFSGVAGTVGVDNSLGQVAATGMQFAVGGYRIEGGTLALVGPQATIRVGDGTAGGAGMTATIASSLSGAAELEKSDLGTLVLTGANSYAGGTAINGGTLQVAADTALGDAAGRLSFDGGILRTTADMTSRRSINLTGQGTMLTDGGTRLTLDGVLSGAGAFKKAGEGTLVLTADSSAYRGPTSVDDGALAVNGALGGSLTVGDRGRLEGTGRVGATRNSGIVAPGSGDIGTLTIQGNYTGSGGVIEIAAVLGGDNSRTSRLVVKGATSGDGRISVINRGGLGGQTKEGIKIVDVTGASNGTFTLAGDYLFQGEQAVVGGAFGYRLRKNGLTGPDDGDWYLRSGLPDPKEPGEPRPPLYQPGVPLYENYAASLQEFNKPGTLRQRVGNRVWAPRADKAQDSASGHKTIDRNGIWARIEAAHAEFAPAVSTSSSTYDASTWKLQTGIDGLLVENDAGRFIGGVSLQYGTVSSGILSPYGIGGISTTGYGVGATLTWYGENGFYADGQAQLNWYESDLASATVGRELVTGNGGMGYSLSLEAGRQVALGGNWSVTPQAQLAYSSVRFDDFADAFGAQVSMDGGRSLMSRLGIAASHDVEWRDANGRLGRAHLYGIANVYYEFAGASDVDVSGTGFSSGNDRLYGGIGLGGSLDWADDRYSLYGEARLNTSLENIGDSNAIGGTLGFRMRW